MSNIKEHYAQLNQEMRAKLLENVGLRCKCLSFPLAGKEATIIDVKGEMPDGFRYEIKLDEPLYSWQTELNYYPPTFKVEVLKPF